MQLSHDPARVDVVFDEANLVSCAGLTPMLALAERAGLSRLLAEHVSVPSPNAPLKITSLVAGMLAGADSIDDMDLLRHGAMGVLFGGVRAPSTLGTFLRAFRFGHVRQLDAVAGRLLTALAAQTLPGADRVAYIDIDDTVRATHGYLKQGAGFRVLRRERPERTAGGRLDPAGSAGDRRRPAAQGLDELRAGRGPPGYRRPDRGPSRRGRPEGGIAGHHEDGQRVLQPRRDRRGSPGWGEVLGDRADGSYCPGRDREHRRRGVDYDPVGAQNSAVLGDLRVFVEQPAEAVASADPDVVP
jgi:hypothetical protein